MDEYKIKTVEEGLTKIQFPEFDKISSDAPVFYNPHMELNRDISILALQTFQKQEDRNINICDLFGGSGIRGVRYKNEIDGVGHVFINDISETANEYERHNVELNNLKDIEIFQHDAGTGRGDGKTGARRVAASTRLSAQASQADHSTCDRKCAPWAMRP